MKAGVKDPANPTSAGDSACAIPPPTLPSWVVEVIEAYTAAIATRLAEIDEQMQMIKDIECNVAVEPSGRCCLSFRAYR